MSRYFIVEVKDKHITRHEIFLALVEKLGLGVVVTVEPASQQNMHPTLLQSPQEYEAWLRAEFERMGFEFKPQSG